MCDFHSDDDSANTKNILVLQEKIAKLQCQNKVNIQQLYELEYKGEKKTKLFIEKEKMMIKFKHENEELKKELIVKKKFVFNM